MHDLELFTSPYCPYCASMNEQLRAILDQDAPGRFILRECSVLDNLDRAVDLGIRRVPALIIDNRLAHQGPITKQDLQRLIGDLRCPE